jgi:hypothetical protein
MMPVRHVLPACVACLCLGVAAPAVAQVKSGPQSVDACTAVPKAQLDVAVGKPLKAQKVSPGTPTSLGVSVCMWATADGRKTLSISTYAPAAVRNTQAKTIDAYFESLKTQNAQFSGRPKVIAGVRKRAVSFASARGVGDTILVLRDDCAIVMNVGGFASADLPALAKAAGQR